MDRKEICNRALEILRASGAEGDVYFEERDSLSLLVREGQLEEVRRSSVRGMAIRAMREGRLGFTHTTSVDPDGAVAAARQALELAATASPREDLMIPDAVGSQDGRDEGEDLGIYDPSIEGRSTQGKEDRARATEAIARGYDERIVRTEGSSYRESRTGLWIANTKGLFRHCRRSGVEVGVEVVAEQDGEKQPGSVGAEVCRWSDLPSAHELGTRAAERAIRLLGGRPVLSGAYPVVFSPETGYALLIYLSNALRGDHLSRKRSWLADLEGKEIGSDLVTVQDQPRQPGGPASLPFDAEGVDTRDLMLITKGKVTGSLLDLSSAKRMGASSTGSSRRGGYESLPGIATSNLSLAPGKQEPEEIVAGVENGFWVWGLSGWWIGLDPSNPQFSTAANGLWIEKGKPARPVARVTLAGPIREILQKIDAVGNDLVWDRPTKTPTFRVSEMAVSGI